MRLTANDDEESVPFVFIAHRACSWAARGKKRLSKIEIFVLPRPRKVSKELINRAQKESTDFFGAFFLIYFVSCEHARSAIEVLCFLSFKKGSAL